MNWLAQRAAATPNALALVADGQRLTWRELDARAQASAARLAAAGVRAGERAGLWLPPGVEFVCALHALWQLGAIAVPVNLRLPAPQAWRQLAALAPRVVLRADANTPEVFADVAPAAALKGAAQKSRGNEASKHDTSATRAAAQQASSEREVVAARDAVLRPDGAVSSLRARETARREAGDAAAGPRVDFETRAARQQHLRNAGADADAALFPSSRAAAPAGDGVALILFTSGTTGAPKAACLRFSNLAASARASASALGSGARDRWLLCLPLFHVGGLSILVRAVFDGAAVVLQRGFDARQVSRALDEESITRISLVPTTLARVLDARGGRRAPAGLATVLLGGAACPAQLLARARALGFPVCASYGLTETASQIANEAQARSAMAPAARARGASVRGLIVRARNAAAWFRKRGARAADKTCTRGRRWLAWFRKREARAVARRGGSKAHSLNEPAVCALPGFDVRVVDAAGRALAAGRIGEIQVRGATVFAGYWNDAAATRAAFAGEWLRTGDLGALDARGALRVVGRRDDVIITGGENVHPAQVEAALLEHADVAEAAVWWQPDADLGQRVAAWVVRRKGARADAEALRAHCRERLADYQCPREFFWVDELPRNALGKVLKPRSGA